MIEAAEPPRIHVWIEGRNGFGRPGAEIGQSPFHRRQHDFDITVGKGRRNQAHHLTIPWIVVPMNELHRVVLNVLFPGKRSEETVEVMFETEVDHKKKSPQMTP